MMQTGFSDFMSEHALVQAYISIEQPQIAITILNGMSKRGYVFGLEINLIQRFALTF